MKPLLQITVAIAASHYSGSMLVAQTQKDYDSYLVKATENAQDVGHFPSLPVEGKGQKQLGLGKPIEIGDYEFRAFKFEIPKRPIDFAWRFEVLPGAGIRTWGAFPVQKNPTAKWTNAFTSFIHLPSAAEVGGKAFPTKSYFQAISKDVFAKTANSSAFIVWFCFKKGTAKLELVRDVHMRWANITFRDDGTADPESLMNVLPLWGKDKN